MLLNVIIAITYYLGPGPFVAQCNDLYMGRRCIHHNIAVFQDCSRNWKLVDDLHCQNTGEFMGQLVDQNSTTDSSITYKS